jgi:hypothetical protein
VLDEFGNLPKFENMEGMVTVARSRGIRFLFVLQSFSQLTAKYGREIGDIVKTNCNVKIFIGSDDADTRKEFSELCGQKKIKNFSVNTNAETSPSSNTGASNQPLISVGMLERLNGNEKGDAIVSVRGYEPIWTVFTPSYELKDIYFKEGKAAIGKREAVFFDKSNYVFDIHGESDDIKVLDAIDKREMEEDEQDKVKQAKIMALDQEWQSIVNEIDLKLKKFVEVLKGKDSKVVMNVGIGSKATFLYNIMENYDKPRAIQIQEMADYISAQLPKLKDLQEQAGK